MKKRYNFISNNINNKKTLEDFRRMNDFLNLLLTDSWFFFIEKCVFFFFIRQKSEYLNTVFIKTFMIINVYLYDRFLTLRHNKNVFIFIRLFK